MQASNLEIPLKFTSLAVEKIKTALSMRGEGLGIRLMLVKSGCAGWSYAMRYVDEVEADDLRFSCEGFSFFVKKTIYPHIKGVMLDYRIEDLEEGFTFIHSKPDEQCGCGKSFSYGSND